MSIIIGGEDPAAVEARKQAWADGATARAAEATKRAAPSPSAAVSVPQLREDHNMLVALLTFLGVLK